MKQSDIVHYFPVAWASNPDNGTFSVIPRDDPGDGSASLTKGFPIQTMTPLAAGGKPPRGDQFNGILNMLSETARQREAGIIPPWNNDFAQAIGGYPATAHVTLLTNGIPDILISISDNNLDNPSDPEQINWISIKENLALQSELEGYQPKGNYALSEDVPVGMPCPWPLPTPPDGWLIMQGQFFDKTAYPQLAAAYPQGYLPDMRGNYISGFDPTGNNDDRGRALLSWQGDAIRNIWGNAGIMRSYGNNWYAHGAMTVENINEGDMSHSGTYDTFGEVGINAALLVPTASKNRPSNWAFNFIVRAK